MNSEHNHIYSCCLQNTMFTFSIVVNTLCKLLEGGYAHFTNYWTPMPPSYVYVCYICCTLSDIDITQEVARVIPTSPKRYLDVMSQEFNNLQL